MACYSPNAGEGLKRMDVKRAYAADLTAHLTALQARKPIICAGDLNVAHTPLDLARPKGNEKTPGFTPTERADFTHMLERCDLVDSFRARHPDTPGCYTYYSYRFNCRAKGIGWRLDYFLTSLGMDQDVRACAIRKDMDPGPSSDHVPLVLELQRKPYF